MPQFTFTDSAGTPWTVNAPNGATESQAFAQFQAQQRASGVGTSSADAQGYSVPTGDTSGMSLFDRVAANIGAGASNLVEGAAQLLGAKKPGSFLGIDYDPTPQGIATKRALDEALAQSTGGGSLLQDIGEQLPFMAIPFGSFLRGGQALTQGAMNLGRLAAGSAARPLALTVARGLPAAVGESVALGATQAALQPTDPTQSRLVNTTLGGIASGVLPLGIGAVGKGLAYLTPGAAVGRAGAALTDALGGSANAQNAVTQVQRYGFGAPLTRDIPMTTAELTGDPALFRAQRTAQAQNSAQWAPFRESQAQARFENLQSATGSADNLDSLVQARDDATTPLREKALSAASADQWFDVPVRNTLQNIVGGDTITNPATRSIVGYVQNALESGITPQRLYTVRKVLTDGLNGPTVIGDQISNAAKMAGADTMKIVGSIDDALNAASGGKWSKYLTKYQQMSGPVNDALASSNLRDVYAKEGAPQLGGVPEVTGANLGRAIDKVGSNDYGSLFDADTRARIQALQDNLAMTEQPQKLLRLVGTSGGGSNTPMDLFAATRAGMGNAISGVLGRVPIVSSLMKGAGAATDAALNRALMYPDAFTSAVLGNLRLSQPYGTLGDLAMRGVRATSVGIPQQELSPQ